MRLPVLLCALVISLAGLASAFMHKRFPRSPAHHRALPPGERPTSPAAAREQMAKAWAAGDRRESSGRRAVIGYELAARAAGDGHTLLVVFPSFVINPSVKPGSGTILERLQGRRADDSVPMVFASILGAGKIARGAGRARASEARHDRLRNASAGTRTT